MAIELFAKGLEAARTNLAPLAFQLKKHLPEILVGGGVVSIAGGTVLACRATLKAESILNEEIPLCVTEKEAKKEAIRKGGKVAVAYLPAAGLLVGGTGMLVAAKSIEHRRVVAALGAYSSLQTMFETYRERVISEHGEDADKRALEGKTLEKLEMEEESEEGKKPKKKKQDIFVKEFEDEDPFHRLFDETTSPHEWRNNLDENRFFLECQQKALNIKLKHTGRVFLNDVYEALGLPYLPIGQFVGWVSDDIEGSKDGYIDFGIDYSYLRSEIEAAQMEGRNPEPSIWINLNPDGEVWSNPMKKKYDA